MKHLTFGVNVSVYLATQALRINKLLCQYCLGQNNQSFLQPNRSSFTLPPFFQCCPVTPSIVSWDYDGTLVRPYKDPMGCPCQNSNFINLNFSPLCGRSADLARCVYSHMSSTPNNGGGEGYAPISPLLKGLCSPIPSPPR